MSNRRAYIIVSLAVVFLCAAAVAIFVDHSTDRSFRRFVISVDMDKVQSINILRPLDGLSLEFVREGDDWNVVVPSGAMEANSRKIESLLAYLVGVQAIRQMSNSENVWEQYGVIDSIATRVIVRGKKKTLADFYFGNTDFDAQTQEISCYIRNAGDSRIYKVDGYLGPALSGGFDAWVRKY
ncbi:MAG: DUF4340 domain-containing protein [Salinivirgaceae bacterium]|nr:DUF4340 domain-containing protein [Salinivirgaceae bacterium]